MILIKGKTISSLYLAIRLLMDEVTDEIIMTYDTVEKEDKAVIINASVRAYIWSLSQELLQDLNRFPFRKILSISDSDECIEELEETILVERYKLKSILTNFLVKKGGKIISCNNAQLEEIKELEKTAEYIVISDETDNNTIKVNAPINRNVKMSASLIKRMYLPNEEILTSPAEIRIGNSISPAYLEDINILTAIEAYKAIKSPDGKEESIRKYNLEATKLVKETDSLHLYKEERLKVLSFHVGLTS